MATIEELQRGIDQFLTEQMTAALAAVEYPADSQGRSLGEIASAEVDCRHAPGASDAFFRVTAFKERLDFLVQLNVWRFVVVYSIPEAADTDTAVLRTRLERWQIGAEHAGWQIGWRPSVLPEHAASRVTQIYCYANADRNLLEDPGQQLFWRTDIAQMTRALLLEARRAGVPLGLDRPPA